MRHGTVRLSADKKQLVVVTMRKKGKKRVRHAVAYKVQDVNPDKRVANPAYSLTKLDGTVYHVAQTEFGPTCSCGDANWRGSEKRAACKHILSLRAVKLLPLLPK